MSGVPAAPLLDELCDTGIVKLPGAFEARHAARMRDVVWNELHHRYGIERDDPTTWHRHAPTGLRSTKRSSAFAPICGPQVVELLDALLGRGEWARPKHFGNVLVTMPNASHYRVPDAIWHSDFAPTLAVEPLTVVKLWALFDDVEPGGGGTPQLAGSHRAFGRWVAHAGERDYKRAKRGFLASHPWLRELTRDDGDPDRNQRLFGGTDVEGISMRVVECTGHAGDVYVTHPWVFHSIAPNATSRPRLMRSVAVGTLRFA